MLSTAVCRQIKDGIAGVFGPMSQYSAEHVQAVCSTLGIPHLEIRWDATSQPQRDTSSINLYPQHEMISRALLDAVRFWHWETFAILYENDDGICRH
jgi:hypothetical protein